MAVSYYQQHRPREVTVTVSVTPDFSGDWVAAGANMQVEINASLTFVSALGGGEVRLLAGTYTIDDPIAFPGNTLTLSGLGRATFIDGDALANTENAIEITGRTDCVVRDLSIQTNDGGDLTIHCIFIEDGSDRFRIENVTVVNSDSEGIHVDGTNILEGWITNCDILDADGNGVYVGMDAANYMDYLHVTGCTVTSADLSGINYAFRVRYSTISDCIVDSSGFFGLEIAEASISNVVSGCSSSNNGQSGINIDTTSSNVVNDNIFYNNTFHGVLLDSDAYNNLITGNYMYDNSQTGVNIVTAGSVNNVISGNYIWANTTHGIRVNAADETRILGNYIWDNSRFGTNVYDGISIEDDADNTTIMGNTIRIPRHEYGVDITTADCDGTLVLFNDLRNSGATNMINDLGTGTILPTVQMPFIQGTTFISAADNPWGWEIDADTEFAIALGKLPLEVQQVVRINIWAVGLVAPGASEYMRAQFTGEAGASDEPYTTEAIDVVDKPNVELKFAANDVIHWILTSADDADIGDILGGDSIQFKVLHEGAGGSDIETDAIFRCIEIEYV